MTGVTWAVISAMALGANSVLVAFVARGIGVLRTTGISITIAFLFLAVYALAARLRFELPAHQVAVLVSLAAAAATAFLASYRALQVGPVSVVSPISATNGAMTVLFAFAFIGERPDAVQWFGIPVAAAGAVLVSVRRFAGSRISLVGIGPGFAALGAASGAISNAGLRIPIREVGAVQAILVQRAFTIVYVWLALLGVVARRNGQQSLSRDRRRLQPHDLVLLGSVGLLDAVSFLSFARALSSSPAWLVGMLSQSGRAIAVVGGLLLFGERLRGCQWLGIALLGLGLTLVVL